MLLAGILTLWPTMVMCAISEDAAGGRTHPTPPAPHLTPQDGVPAAQQGASKASGQGIDLVAADLSPDGIVWNAMQARFEPGACPDHILLGAIAALPFLCPHRYMIWAEASGSNPACIAVQTMPSGLKSAVIFSAVSIPWPEALLAPSCRAGR